MPEQQPSTAPEPKNSSTAPEPENLWLNLGFNLLVPILLLSKGKAWFGHLLEPYFENVAVPILIIALAFPVGYFAYDYVKRRKYNLFSILGLISVLLTGGIGILEIPTPWFAVKEAAIPMILGLAVIVSLKTPYPLVRTLLFNREIMDVDKVQGRLDARGTVPDFDALLTRCTWLLAASFLLSATLNYVLASNIVVSPSGTDAFNAEVSKMMAWSWPVIVIPSMVIMMVALWMLLGGIHKLTGLELDEVIRARDGHGTGSEKETERAPRR